MLGPFRNAQGRLTSTGEATVTVITMFCTCFVGFMYQQHLIEKYYSGEEAELHMMVKQIKQQELAEIARRGEASAAARRAAQSGNESER